jgi:hypothetical protein
LRVRARHDEQRRLVYDVGRSRLKGIVVLKAAPDARRETLSALIDSALLESCASARADQVDGPRFCGGIVWAPRLTDDMTRALAEHAREVIPSLRPPRNATPAWGLLDGEGRMELHADVLLDESRPPTRSGWASTPSRLQALVFSDRGQWVLKVLLAGRIDPRLLTAPRTQFTSAQQLAREAGVGTMTAHRVVRGLIETGFMRQAQRSLEIVRIAELLREWRTHARRARREVLADPVLPTADAAARVRERLGQRAVDGPAERGRHRRACLAGAGAWAELGISVVQGAQPTLHVDDIGPHALEALGLRATEAPVGAIRVRVPAFPESVFRGAASPRGVPCTDVIQCWLDLRHEHVRAEEQSRALENGPLADLFGAPA